MAGAARRVMVGIGNPILTDDAAGLLLAREARRRLGGGEWDLIELAAGGLEIMESLLGYEQAVVVDSIVTGRGTPGELFLVDPEHGLAAGGESTHQVGLFEGLELGRRLGLPVPGDLRVYALEVADPLTFGTRLTPEVEASIAGAAARIAAEVGG